LNESGFYIINGSEVHGWMEDQRNDLSFGAKLKEKALYRYRDCRVLWYDPVTGRNLPTCGIICPEEGGRMYLRNVSRYPLRCTGSPSQNFTVPALRTPNLANLICIPKPAVTTGWLKVLLRCRKFLSLIPVEMLVAWWLCTVVLLFNSGQGLESFIKGQRLIYLYIVLLLDVDIRVITQRYITFAVNLLGCAAVSMFVVGFGFSLFWRPFFLTKVHNLLNSRSSFILPFPRTILTLLSIFCFFRVCVLRDGFFYQYSECISCVLNPGMRYLLRLFCLNNNRYSLTT